MIRQKDIEKCKFFTTTGADIWRTKKVRLITEVELVNCETGQTETARVAEESAEKFVAIAIPRIAPHRKTRDERRGTTEDGRWKTDEGRGTKGKRRVKRVPKKRGKRKRGRPPKNSELKTQSSKLIKRGCRKGKSPSSQYLGVTIHQAKSGLKYYAQINRGGKYKNLGIHNAEELAAAAVQEHLGNHAEAERLTELAKQKTDTTIKELKGQTGPMWFLCSGCGADYEKQPEKCGKCGGGSFEEIQPDAKKKG